MHRWAGAFGAAEQTGYTVCYLTNLSSTQISGSTSGRAASKCNPLFGEHDDVTAFRQVVNPSQLSLSDTEQLCFHKAMNSLNLRPCYHLSDLEPHLIHPIQDKALSEICSCSKCRNPGSSQKPRDKADLLAEYLKDKNRGIFDSVLCDVQ